MRKFLEQKKEFIALLAYLAVVAALVFFVILPLKNRAENVGQQIQEDSANQKMISQRIAQLPKIRQQYDSMKSKEGQLDVLLGQSDAVTLIEYLEKMAADTNNEVKITVQDKAPTPPKPAPKGKVDENALVNGLPSPNYMQMNISLTGQYKDILDFMGKLENSKYYSDMINLQIKVSEDEDVPVNSTIGTDAANPFATAAETKTNQAQTAASSKPQEVNATFDVVFYTKK